MNKKGFFPGFATALRVAIGAGVYFLLTWIFSFTPMPASVSWKVALGIVIASGLISYKLIPII